MDGGEREQKTAEELKRMVKAKASERRERKWALWIEGEEKQTNPPSLSIDDETALSRSMDSSMILNSNTGSMPPRLTPATSVTGDSGSGDLSPSPNAPLPTPGTSPWAQAPVDSTQSPNGSVPVNGLHPADSVNPNSEQDLRFIMIYLDYVFPFLSPYYRPDMLEGGRGWLLVLLLKNKSLFHIALSLASYFFAAMLQDQVDGHAECRQINWAELQKQQGLAIKELRQDMDCINERGISASFEDGLQVLESIMQLLQFELAIANMENWQVHLDAASELFEQIVQVHATCPGNPWYSILERMSEVSLSIPLARHKHPWSSDQAAFRFFTAQILWVDILAGTATQRAPRLERFHSQLLEGHQPMLRFEEFNGCYTWVLLLIGKVAALDAWKKEMRATSSLSLVELIQRASCIESQLREGIARLDRMPMDNHHRPSTRAFDIPYSGFGIDALTQADNLHASPLFSLNTKIWAQSALTYLAVVVNGFQPALPDIRDSVAATTELFRAMPSPICLRTLAWPFAVTGCLSPPSNDSFFQDLVSNMGSMHAFGTVNEALAITTTVWEHRTCAEAANWDIAACLGVLGHKSLLV